MVKLAHIVWALIAISIAVIIFTTVDYYSGLLRISDYLPKDYAYGPCYKPLVGCGISMYDAFNVVVLFSVLLTFGLVLLYLINKKNRIRKVA